MHDNAEGTSRGLLSLVADVLSASGIMKNRYFTTLQSGETSLDTFRRSQQQFYFAVDYFSRPMSALMMRLPRGDKRLGILGLETTRGDRLFIGLLGSAYVFIAWLGLITAPLWFPLAIAVAWIGFCFWKV